MNNMNNVSSVSNTNTVNNTVTVNRTLTVTNPTQSQLRYSRIQDHNRYPQTDNLYNPLRKILLRPEQLVAARSYLNPAAQHSRVTRDFVYLTEAEARDMRDKTLIPVDQKLVPTYDLDKVRGTRFMAVDAREAVVGPPISAEEMQRIRSQGLRQQRVVYDFAAQNNNQVIQQQQTEIQKQTKIIKEQLKTTYRPPQIDQYYQGKSKGENKYKYNLYSMLDEAANGQGCGCPGNEIIASKNQPQSINWLN